MGDPNGKGPSLPPFQQPDPRFWPPPQQSDLQLTLPGLESEIARMEFARWLESVMRGPGWRIDFWLRPNFQHLSPLAWPVKPPPSPSDPVVGRRGAGPKEPKPATMGSLLGALWQLNAVQSIARDARCEVLGLFFGGWKGATTGQRTIMVSRAAAFGAPAIAGILAAAPARDLAFSLLKGTDIPVPFVTGLSVQFTDLPKGHSADFGVELTYKW